MPSVHDQLLCECRLGANSELNTLPHVVLSHIMKSAFQPCLLQLYDVKSGVLIELPDDTGH